MQADIHRNAASKSHAQPLQAGPSVSSVAFRKSLQLTRASTMALTRLQLALTRSDKHQARVAMDCLLDIDAELEGCVADILIPQELDDADWQSISEHLKALKTAIASEKLALAGEMSGPAFTPPPANGYPEMEVEEPPLVDWPRIRTEEGAPFESEYHSGLVERWMPRALMLLVALAIGIGGYLAITLL
jgi:hypothetical protein